MPPLVGMPLGPLQLVDETSIDLGVKIAKATRAAMGDDYPDGAVDDVLFWMADQGRMGRKSNSGFYSYDDKGKRQGVWEGLAARNAQSATLSRIWPKSSIACSLPKCWKRCAHSKRAC